MAGRVSVRGVVKGLAAVLVAAGIVAAAADAMASLMAQSLVITPLGQTWYDWSPSTLNALQAGVQRRLAPWLWDPGLVTVLLWPTAAVLIGLGVLVWLLAGIGGARMRRRPLTD
jgi:hypothetical protein